MSEERAAYEAEELRGLAEMHGATRVRIEGGAYAWRFPAWVCPFCGPDAEVQPGCPDPLARHGAVAEKAARGGG